MNHRDHNGAEHLPDQGFHSPRARFEFISTGAAGRTAAITSAPRNPADDLGLEKKSARRTKRELLVFWLLLGAILALSFLAFWLLWTKIHGHF